MTRSYLAIALALTAVLPAAAQNKSETVWMMVQHDAADYQAWQDVFDNGFGDL